MRTLNDIHALYGKRILMRVDFNVPFYESGNVADDTRIRAHLPTIEYLIKAGAKVALVSHLGDSDKSMQPVAERLSFLLEGAVTYVSDCIGDVVHDTLDNLPNGSVLLLENVRRHAGEKKNDESFAQKLADGFDIYLNDAFATAHRKHASTYGVTDFFNEKAAGLLMQTEIETLSKALKKPEKPFLVMIGGAKVSSKLGVLQSLVKVADTILVGGAMANTFLKATGVDVKNSLVEDDMLKEAINVLQMAKSHDCEFILPADATVSRKLEKNASTENPNVNDIPDGHMILDIGKHTQAVWAEKIKEAKTILWNGPCGVFEISPFHLGTQAVAEAVSKAEAFTLIGGGDTLHAAEMFKVKDKMDYVSTGGGSLLEFLEGQELPAVEALK